MGANVSFVPLRTESVYSFPDGLCRPDALAERAAAVGYSAVGMVERGTLHGAFEFYHAARSHGIKPILGCDLPVYAEKTGRHTLHPVTFFAETMEGWHNLVRLVSHAHVEAPEPDDPAICSDRIDAWCRGLIALVEPEVIETSVGRNLADMLGRDCFFLEYRLRSNRSLPAVARAASDRSVVTASVQYLDADEAEIHAHLRTIRGAPPERVPDGLPFWDAARVRDRCIGYEEAMERAAEIAGRCTVTFPENPPLLFPRYEIPPDYRAPEGPPGHREFAYLEAMAAEGLQRRFGIKTLREPMGAASRAVIERFRHELEIIRRTGFVHYFLVVWDMVRFARSRGIPVGPGRGSGAGSLVAYALEITDIDPLRFRLVFERFLNPERVSPPDFDIDFAPDRRGEVIDYIRSRYGSDRVAHIVTFHRFGVRQAVRDVARVLGLPPAEGERLSRIVPELPQGAGSASWSHPDVQEAERAVPVAKRVFRLARALDGVPRNTGTHAAGIVIGTQPLHETVPLMQDRSGHVMTQFEMGPLAQTGLLKIDLLGLATLGVIQETRGTLAALGLSPPDWATVPDDDADTFDRLSRGDTIGIFQLESEGMRDLLRRVRVDRFEELVAVLALYRPGPMHMLDEYVRRGADGDVAVEHPALEPILSETRGLMLYQEQVQQAAQALAGFSLGKGDIVRRAMAKKDTSAMAELRVAFVEGCRRLHRMPPEQAGRIFDVMERFAGYGFNKSHSVAYATLSYRCAWLKTHYPLAFMAAWLSSQVHDPDKLRAGFEEVRMMGWDIRPPDVQRSGVRFAVEEKAIRFGLAAVRHVGADAAAAIVAERESGGAYRGVMDFCLRVRPAGVHRPALKSLIQGGALDAFGVPRGQMLAGVGAAWAHAARVQRDRESGQMALFSGEPEELADDALPRAGADAWTDEELAEAERDALGLCVSHTFRSDDHWFLSRCSPYTGEESLSSRLRRVQDVRIHMGAALLREDRLAALRTVVQTHAGPIPAILALSFPDGRRVFIRIGTPSGVTVSERLIREVEAVTGLHTVYFQLDEG